MNNNSINTNNNATSTPARKNYIGLAFSGSMLDFSNAEILAEGGIDATNDPNAVLELPIKAQLLTLPTVLNLLAEEEHISCCNVQHIETLKVLRAQTGIEIAAPDRAPSITLKRGDTLLTFQVTGLGRLPEGQKEYTAEQIAAAKFKWIRYVIL